ncbi:MlaD family protein [Aldersonia kunmingensis]|uniref:MlaD family protein n=1 Tax=Aldersonia kunmingensis TaxID=408066 RepID=UPI00083425E6|nr:MlaD family protein [Aldersonia kunmingensis]
MTKAKKWAVVAVVTVAALGIGTGVAVAVLNNPARTASYCAQMPDAVGLYAGNPVTQMGFEVGTIDSITEKGDRVEVTFSTSVGRMFPADVKAVTRSKSILADRTLELVGNHTSGPVLQPGSCIPLEQSFTPKTISEVVGSAADFLKALSPDGSDTVAGAIAGVAAALQGQGEPARAVMLSATGAMENPDTLVADIGTAIGAMAPLNEQALADWGAITSIAQQLPEIATAGIDLFPGTIDVCVGIGWLVAVLYDIQTRYGADIWPFVHGQVAQAISLAAGRAGDLSGLVGSLPSFTAALGEQSRQPSGLTMHYTPPTVTLGDGSGIDPANLLGEVLGKAAGQ